MAILPDGIVNKIMTYVSHPVADLFKAHVSFTPGIMENDTDAITIGIHDGNHMYADNMWYTKEHECQHYSDKMEEFVLFKILHSKMMKLKTYDTFNDDCPMWKKNDYMRRNLDPMFIHTHREILREETGPFDYDQLFRSLTDSAEEYMQQSAKYEADCGLRIPPIAACTPQRYRLSFGTIDRNRMARSLHEESPYEYV